MRLLDIIAIFINKKYSNGHKYRILASVQKITSFPFPFPVQRIRQDVSKKAHVILKHEKVFFTEYFIEICRLMSHCDSKKYILNFKWRKNKS